MPSRSFAGITLGLSSSDVIVKQVPLPLMDDDEVPGALRFEARKHLPFDPATCVIDYQVLGPATRPRSGWTCCSPRFPQQRLDRALAPLATARP